MKKFTPFILAALLGTCSVAVSACGGSDDDKDEATVECNETKKCADANKVCKENKCVAKDAETTVECDDTKKCADANKVCKENKCVDKDAETTVECDDTKKCADANKVCKENKCVDKDAETTVECDDTKKCADENKVCKENKCVDKEAETKPECDDANPCADDKECVAGKCQVKGANGQPECADDDPCKSGFECINGKCEPEAPAENKPACGKDGACTDGKVCYKDACLTLDELKAASCDPSSDGMACAGNNVVTCNDWNGTPVVSVEACKANTTCVENEGSAICAATCTKDEAGKKTDTMCDPDKYDAEEGISRGEIILKCTEIGGKYYMVIDSKKDCSGMETCDDSSNKCN